MNKIWGKRTLFSSKMVARENGQRAMLWPWIQASKVIKIWLFLVLIFDKYTLILHKKEPIMSLTWPCSFAAAGLLASTAISPRASSNMSSPGSWLDWTFWAARLPWRTSCTEKYSNARYHLFKNYHLSNSPHWFWCYFYHWLGEVIQKSKQFIFLWFIYFHLLSDHGFDYWEKLDNYHLWDSKTSTRISLTNHHVSPNAHFVP